MWSTTGAASKLSKKTHPPQTGRSAHDIFQKSRGGLDRALVPLRKAQKGPLINRTPGGQPKDRRETAKICWGTRSTRIKDQWRAWGGTIVEGGGKTRTGRGRTDDKLSR